MNNAAYPRRNGPGQYGTRDPFPPHPSRCIAASVLAAAALSLLPGCNKAPTAGAVPPPDVEVITVAPRDVPVYREWIGTLDGLVHAHVHPQVTGYLLAIRYNEGTLVKKDDVMFEIDARPFRAVLEQALARLGKDELDVNRLKPLMKENAVSRQELDDAMQAYLGDKAAADQARLNVEFTKVTSPIDGLAGLAIANIGDLVGPGTEELTTVSTVNPIKAYFTVSEQEYLQRVSRYLDKAAEPGSEPNLDLILSDDSLYPHKGRFYFLDRAVDAQSRRQPSGPPHRRITRGGAFPESRERAPARPVRPRAPHPNPTRRSGCAAACRHRTAGQ